MNYEKLKSEYLEKLVNTQNVLKELPKFEKYGIFEKKDLNILANVKKQNELYLEKLTKGEIEVAIVGLENSGKSTFANALIKVKEAFPTGSIRTTFTSTKLKYGREDQAVVEFFTKNDFDNMFSEMLEKIKYPEYKTSKFEIMDIKKYMSYLDNLKDTDSSTYKNYQTTIDDVKSIIEGKDIIFQYLGLANRKFSKNEIENQELKKFIVDEYIARTVKNVDLELSEFEDTKEMVLYDVPGFNSITEKHKIETRKSLNRADAVILIKNFISNTQITSEEKSMLNAYDENSGIALNEKLFVFGTQIDRANKKEDAITNINTLKIDLVKDLNVDTNKIFWGSPFAYMQQIGLEDGDKYVAQLKDWGIEKSIKSIDSIRNAIKDFYKNEAFNNIQRQINKNIESLKNVLNNTITNSEDKEKMMKLQDNELNLIINYISEIEENIVDKLSIINESIKKEIREEQFFSKKLKESINTVAKHVKLEELEKINAPLQGTSSYFAVDKVNHEIRKQIDKNIKEDFAEVLVNIANEKNESYFLQVINTMSSILNITEDNIYKDEIINNLEKFIKELTQNVAYDEKSYVYLIERFSTNVISVLIGTAKGSISRQDEFLEAKKELISLAVFYEDVENYNDIYSLQLIKKILDLPDAEIEDSSIKNNSNIDKKFPELIKFDEFDEIKDIVKDNNIQESDFITILNEVKHRFSEINDKNIKIVIKRIKEKLNTLPKDKNTESKEKKDLLYSLYEDVKPSKTRDELLEELNSDIDKAKDILKTAVIKACDLELPFINSQDKQIKKIINSKLEIKKFIQNNFRKIKYQELKNSEEEKVLIEERNRVIKNIKELLVKI